jgi:hypothetical protein
MNKRQEEKIYKRKFQELHAELYKRYMDIDVKPCRVKIKKVISPDGRCIKVVSQARGYEIAIKLEGTDE